MAPLKLPTVTNTDFLETRDRDGSDDSRQGYWKVSRILLSPINTMHERIRQCSSNELLVCDKSDSDKYVASCNCQKNKSLVVYFSA